VSDSRPHVLAILPALIPSTLICVVKPLIQLHRAGCIAAKLTLESFATIRDLKRADLVVFCRNTEPRHGHLLDFLLKQRIPFIYDLDDNFFELPLDSDIGRYHRAPERLAILTNYLKSADFVRVYSEPLLERVKTLNRNVEKVFGPIDLGLISSPKENSKSKRVSLVYATSRIYDDLAAMFMPALTRVLDMYVGRIEVHFWGIKPEGLSVYRDIHSHALTSSYDKFLRQFSEAGFDIGLAPLRNDIFHLSKTNNKFREYGACRIAGIYSDVDVYSSCITHGETGLLVSNDPDSWHKAIVQLIEDRDLRERIKKQARKVVQEHYAQEHFEEIWRNHIKRVLLRKNTCPVSTHPSNEPLQGRESMGALRGHLGYPRESVFSHLRNSVQRLIPHVRKQGLQITFWLLRRHLYSLIILLKLRLITSSVFEFINRRSAKKRSPKGAR
jgi:glycosyltransferase involved in cell wall biosynthesis